MAVDEHTGKPTYQLIIGIPGNSHALDAAKAQGMPADILNAARSYIQSDNGITDIIHRLQCQENELRELKKRLIVQQEKLETERSELEKQKQALIEQENNLQDKETAPITVCYS